MSAVEVVALAVVGLPLLAALVNTGLLLAGDRYARRYAHLVACTAVWTAFAGAVFLVVALALDPTPREVVVYEWMASGGLGMPFGFLIDPLSVTMMLLTTSFSSAIWVFSINYMHNEPGFGRFFTIMPIMVFSMLVLTMANNYALMFLGWEAVGLCMYLVISFYYSREASARSGTRAMVFNRIGDASMLLALFLIVDNFGTLSYTQVFAQAEGASQGSLTAISLCLTAGILGKSCQLPLGTWLSSAMEGPTPASAMIHAAVQDGIYLVARSHDLFDGAPDAMLLLAVIGASTAVYGALVGLAQTDIKGLLALSTTSQLGLMVFACGLGAYPVAIFHMLTHACVKTYLFLTSPSILHHLHGGADPTAEGRATARPGLTLRLVFGALVVVAAIPFVTGLLDEPVLSRAYSGGGAVLLAIGLIAVFSVLYSTARMVRTAFAPSAGAHGDGQGGPTGLPVTKAVLPLAVVGGIIALGLLAGLLPGGIDGRWFAGFLAPIVPTTDAGNSGSPLLGAAVLALVVAVLFVGWSTPLVFDRFRSERPGVPAVSGTRSYSAALNRFYLDEVYDAAVVRPVLSLSRTLDRFDAGPVDRATSVLEADRRADGQRDRRLGEGLARAATWVEGRVFQSGVNDGAPRVSQSLGRGLTRLESGLGGARATGAAFGLFLLVGVVVLLVGA